MPEKYWIIISVKLIYRIIDIIKVGQVIYFSNEILHLIKKFFK
jgi:hypothetical protein